MSDANKKAYSGMFTSTALPTGGKLSGGSEPKPIVIDRSNRNPLLKKPVGKGSKGDLDSFNIFKPLSGNGTEAGRLVHPDMFSDPFDADRVRHHLPEKKLLEAKRETPVTGGGLSDEEKSPGRKHVQSRVKDGQDKEKAMTGNCQVRDGGKHMTSGCHITATTFDKGLGQCQLPETEANVNYASMARFRSSVVLREEQCCEDILTPNSPDKKIKDFPKGSNNGQTHAGRGSIKMVDGLSDTQNSLVGVLRLDTKKAAKNFDCRPPWGTSEDLYASPAGTMGTSVSSTGAHSPVSPWATY